MSIQIILTNNEPGRWFGRAINTETNKGILNKHKNEIDCYLYSPEETLECLLRQLRNEKLI